MARAPAQRTRLPHPTDRLPLGQGLEVSPFALGLTADPATVTAAFDAGINFFFLSADMHWPIYAAAREGLATLLRRRRKARDRIVVAAVSYVAQPEFSPVPFMELLAEVPKLERIDVLVVGGAYRADLSGRIPRYASMLERKHCGATTLGCSFHERAAAATALRKAHVDIGFIRYNAAHTGAREDLFPRLKQQRPRPLVFNFANTRGYVPPARFKQLGLEGHWQPHVTDHYRFVLSQPRIDGLLCTLKTPAEVRRLEKAMEEEPLSPDEQSHLEMLSRLSRGEAQLA